MVAQRRGADVGLEHRRLRLLDLQDQPVALEVVGPFEERDPAAGADAADADDLAGHVDDLEAVEQLPAVVGERLAVAAIIGTTSSHVCAGVLEVHEQRRVLGEPELARRRRG